jgi:hypothetical protein
LDNAQNDVNASVLRAAMFGHTALKASKWLPVSSQTSVQSFMKMVRPKILHFSVYKLCTLLMATVD